VLLPLLMNCPGMLGQISGGLSDGESWQDFVSRKNLLKVEKQISKKEKEIAKVDRKLQTLNVQMVSGNAPQGILHSLAKLEMQRSEMVVQLSELRIRFVDISERLEDDEEDIELLLL